MYPEPFFPRDEHAEAQAEIERLGFATDPWVPRIATPVLGLNLAFAWPLPAAVRATYEDLRSRLQALDRGAYVYPHAETHVTVATLVNFKNHPEPNAADHARILAQVPELARQLDALVADVPAFDLKIGAPVLVRSAAFLPLLVSTDAIFGLRRRLTDVLAQAGLDEELRVPKAMHSTILRFREPPVDAADFQRRFREIATETTFAPARIEEMLITTETRPYMLSGEIAHRWRLA